MRRPHGIPLAGQTITYLKNARAINLDAELILPGMRGRGRSLSENTFNAALRRLAVWSQPLMEHPCRGIRRMRYGTGFTRERHNDRGGRRAIQHSQESLRALAKRYGVNPKTIAKRKGPTSAADPPTGPKKPKSTVLTVEEEAMIVAFRSHTLQPLDD